MYRQVSVEASHCNFQCILRRSSQQLPIQALRLRTVTYATSASPFLAVRCLNHFAERHAEKYPRAAKAVIKSFYVDDMDRLSKRITKIKKNFQDREDLSFISAGAIIKKRTNG